MQPKQFEYWNVLKISLASNVFGKTAVLALLSFLEKESFSIFILREKSKCPLGILKITSLFSIQYPSSQKNAASNKQSLLKYATITSLNSWIHLHFQWRFCPWNFNNVFVLNFCTCKNHEFGKLRKCILCWLHFGQEHFFQ